MDAAERARLDGLPTPLLARAATPFIALSGTANVVMQLARPEIGYGVADSQVVGARLFDDHARRRRTTVGFLAVAVHGTAVERAAYRRAVNVSHAQVPGGFDHELQRWVGACLYRGFEEAHVAVAGPPSAAVHDRLLAEGVVFGGMLQMPAALWPADRTAFDRYWDDGLAAARIDDHVRAYLMRVIRLEYLHRAVPRRLVERRLHLTTGFLPPPLREQMRLPWTPDDDARFRRTVRRIGFALRHAPRRVREAPFRSAIEDVRARLADGRPLL